MWSLTIGDVVVRPGNVVEYWELCCVALMTRGAHLFSICKVRTSIPGRYSGTSKPSVVSLTGTARGCAIGAMCRCGQGSSRAPSSPGGSDRTRRKRRIPGRGHNSAEISSQPVGTRPLGRASPPRLDPGPTFLRRPSRAGPGSSDENFSGPMTDQYEESGARLPPLGGYLPNC